MKISLLSAAIGAVLVSGVMLSSSVRAQAPSPSIGVTSSSAAAGGSGVFQIYARDVAPPGLGSWTVDISYDESVISVPQCAPTIQTSSCDPHFAPGMIRATGRTTPGHTGDVVIAQLFYDCARAGGSSILEVSLSNVSDASVGGGLALVDVADVDGTVICTSADVSGGAGSGASLASGFSAGRDTGSGAVDPAPGLPAAGSGPSDSRHALSIALPALLLSSIGVGCLTIWARSRSQQRAHVPRLVARH